MSATILEAGQGTGAVQLRFVPGTPRLGKRLVILAHADDAASETHGSMCFIDWTNSPNASALALTLVDAGFLCIAGDFGGTQNFGADPCAQTVYNTWQAAVSAYGCASDGVVIICASMGFDTAYQFAREYPGALKGVYAVEPGLNLTDIYDNNRAGAQAAIGAAWGVTYPTPLPSIADPYLNPSVMAGIPGTIAYSTADTVSLPAYVTTWAAQTGFTTTQVSTTRNHSDAMLDDVPIADIATFLVTNGA